MTHEEKMEIIQKVAKNHRNKEFGYFTKEDIEGEVWLIALKQMHKFDSTRGKHTNEKKSFEHWLNAVIAKRLKNLYRDTYVVPQRLHKGQPNNLLNPIHIDSIQENSHTINFHDIIENKEIWNYLMLHLNDCDLEVLDSLLSGENIPSYYKLKLANKVKELLNDFRKTK